MSAILEFAGVDIRFGGLVAVAGLDMVVEAGSIHALIGPNGAGKSTALNAVSRFNTPRGGDIRFEGESLLPLPPHAISRRGIGRIFKNIELCGRLSTLDNVLIGMSVAFQGRAPDTEAARGLLEQVGLAELAQAPASRLTFGQQKLLDLARALACRPRLLLLDEPAAGLRKREIQALDALLVSLARGGLTILLVEHVMSLVMAVADRITVLNFGQKIAEGAPAEIRGNQAVIEAYLGSRNHAAH